MANQTLTNEIVKQIFYNFGILPDFGKFGISLFKSSRVIGGTYEDGLPFAFPIFSAFLEKNNFRIEALLTDLSDGVTEFALVLQAKDNPIYGLKIEGEVCNFLHFHNQIWKPASILIQSRVLTGSEEIANYGLNWQKSEVNSDLLQALNLLVEFQAH